jgi:hypothetical protein
VVAWRIAVASEPDYRGARELETVQLEPSQRARDLVHWFCADVGVTGLYLSYPTPFNAAVNYLLPLNEANPVESIGDRVLYWLGYAHFGRFGGRIPGCGRGTCNEIFKALWAVVGLVPVIMAVTGAIMWWNRSNVTAIQRVRKDKKTAKTLTTDFRRGR